MRKTLIFKVLFLALVFAPFSLSASGDGGCREGKVNVTQNIIDHIKDNHDWHITDIPMFWSERCEDGRFEMKAIGLHLPWLVYNDQAGLQLFTTHAAGDKGYTIDHGHLTYKDENAKITDLSLTRGSFQWLLIMIFMCWLFLKVAKSYKTRKGQAPKGLQSLLEPVIVFVRDDIGKAYLGDNYKKFTPFLLSVFFGIWFANILGLMPLSSNIAGNPNFSFAFAGMTLLLIIVNASKDFWMHILWYPGVPLLVKFIMLPVEIIGFFAKPFALGVRLFANIVAGHFMTLALVSLIFIIGKSGENVFAGVATAPISVAFGLFIFCLEIIVAAVQAFVFTLLTAVFIGQAMESHDHEQDHEKAH